MPINNLQLATLSKPAVPTWVQGVWRREHIHTDGATRDDAFVIWIQTPILFADLRYPYEDSDAKPEGFAGWLEVEGQICRWHRPIDLHPGPEGADQGAMFVDGDLMLETGLFRNYLEQYRRIALPRRQFAASRGEFSIKNGKPWFSSEGRLELVVAVDDHVIHAIRDGASALSYCRLDSSEESFASVHTVGPCLAEDSSSQDWIVWVDEFDDSVDLLSALRTAQLAGLIVKPVED